MHKFNKWVITGSMLLALFSGAAWSQQFDDIDYDGEGYVPPKKDTKQQALDDSAAENLPVLTAEMPAVKGPKRTVAVGKFSATGAFTEKYGQWDVGGGLAAMLVTALLETDQFIVLERANINQILSEQEMKSKGVGNTETGPKTGKLTGTNLIIYGAVTEFGIKDEGNESGIGANGGGGLGSIFSAAVTHKRAKGKIAMDIRVVDATTSRIISSHSISKKLLSKSTDFTVGYNDMEFGHGRFKNTPIGQASRHVITEAVKKIIEDAQNTNWVGKVVEFDGKELYINSGTNGGIKVGDKFVVERITKKLTDPETGELLGVRKKQLGMLEVTGAEKKLAYGSYSPVDMEAPVRGDRVVEIKEE